MEIKKITTQKKNEKKNDRPIDFDEFVGQDEIKKILQTALDSAKKRNSTLGHILFSGQSGYGKTTIAQIVAKKFGVNIKIITGYAISKPSEIISILNNLEKKDILFIDEIHRIKPNIEEVLYTAMEDFCIDMVMPEGGNVRIALNEFSLIGATTKLESLTSPLKNRFIYTFHFENYTTQQKNQIIKDNLIKLGINTSDNIIEKIGEKVDNTPRTIKNFCIKIRDYLISKNDFLSLENFLDKNEWENFVKRGKLENGGIQEIHKQYLKILSESEGRAVGVRTIAIKMGMNEKAIEEDIEPLLLKLGKIEKTSRGRILL
ncbi:Holliday junction branch migration DNA helicase RuvB [Candidatus Vampirococcus lugosii]|uniref:Holliday junction branch migration complex subunit RuvB n=1 Tax=Candidatus Vampirococcus lugosii TaxID=2789015 RepID=A0ABS5QM52_9BACT|nr:Holliday junction branch migration DNA helicase RuvB [Candidatus Vampirococcus lugosii]MBS8122142.1 Holliday junction ATP-dependent DNA helicase RuvB [Candidatus Vampirococcus lugosii]